MKAQIPWLRVFVEGVVIVGSILLAFGLQAWWEGRQEQGEVGRDLMSVAQELRVNRESVLWQLDEMERKLLGSAEVLRILEADRDAGNRRARRRLPRFGGGYGLQTSCHPPQRWRGNGSASAKRYSNTGSALIRCTSI